MDRVPCVIGVTGLPCAGKSLAAGLVASGEIDGVRGPLLKADDIGHEVLLRADVQDALRGRFGEPFGDAGFAEENPSATRRAVADRVFSSPADLDWLERLVHPLVAEEVRRRSLAAFSAGGGRVVVEAALLFAAGMEKDCGIVVIIEADFAVRRARAASRGWDENELRRREKRLVPLFDAALNSAGSFTKHHLARVDNNGPVDELRDALRESLRRPV